MNRKQTTLVLIIAFVLCCMVTACKDSSSDHTFTNIEELNNPQYTIGTWYSDLADDVIANHFPKAQHQLYEGFSSLMTSLRGHKLDAVLTTKVFFDSYPDKEGLRLLDTSDLGSGGFSFFFSQSEKGRKLREQMNAFIVDNERSGLREELEEIWFSDTSAEQTVSYGSSDPNAGELVFAFEEGAGPFGYIEGQKALGYDIDFASRFCEQYGYHMTVKSLPYSMIAGGYLSGEYDFAGGALETPDPITENPVFSNWYIDSPFVLVVRSEESGNGIFASAGKRFRNAFITDQRWKLYLSGLFTTVLITLVSTLAGSLIGLGMYLASDGSGKILRKFFAFCTTLLNVTPIPVLLLIFYYVVFDSVAISGTWVAIIVFTLIMSGIVYGLLNSSVGAIDPGQWHAAIALGCTRKQAIFQVILPQAMQQFIPLYRDNLINLIKLTSIVGYIAVMDLTKIADVVRARTFDAVFPLFVAAIIYIALALTMIRIINLFFRKTNPKARSQENILAKILPDGQDPAPLMQYKESNMERQKTNIKIEGLGKTFGSHEILHDITTTIHDGDVISVIGPSGCGKSTFMRCLNLMETPTTGKIFLNDLEITSPSVSVADIHTRIGMVFQHFNLFGHLTVLENVMFGPVHVLNKDPKEVYPKAMDLLELIGMKDRAFRYPEDLSGGQKQRVAIARTMIMEPDVILFDEPTSALDPLLVKEVENVIKRLADDGYTMLIVTHEMHFAKEIANRVFYMDDKGIYEDGRPDQIFEQPHKNKTRLFIRHMKAYEVSVDSGNYDFIGIISGITTFGQTNFMAKRLVDNACVIFEELCVQKLIGSYDISDLHYALAYSEESGTAEICIGYRGSREIRLDDENLSDLLIKKAAASIKIDTDADSQYDKNYMILLNE